MSKTKTITLKRAIKKPTTLKKEILKKDNAENDNSENELFWKGIN